MNAVSVSNTDVRFIVVSAPKSRGDRVAALTEWLVTYGSSRVSSRVGLQ